MRKLLSEFIDKVIFNGEINRKIKDNIKRVKTGVDILDLKGGMDIPHSELGYTQNSWNTSKFVKIIDDYKTIILGGNA